MKNVTKLLTTLLMLFAFSTLLFTQVGRAEIMVQVGTGTSGYNLGFDGYYRAQKTQYLYTAAELTGLGAGAITKLGFEFVSSVAGGALLPLNISMAQTTATSLPAGEFVTAGLTLVYSANYLPVLGWQTFNLTTPFVWDGTSNILISICFDQSDWLSHTYISHYNFGVDSQTRYYMTHTAGAGCNAVTANTFTYKANIQFTQASGTLTGIVRDGITMNPIVGATVTGPNGSVQTVAGGVYTMTVTAGTNNYTASAASYISVTQPATVTTGGTTTLNFNMLLPPTAQGIVTNAANGVPIKGAKVEIDGKSTYTVAGGFYSLLLNSTGDYTVNGSKPGFDVNSAVGHFPTPGTIVTVDLTLNETCNKATQPFTAALNTGSTAVNLNWGLPKGYYELIYDDGIEDLSTVWALGGNMNAMKFTGLSYPIQVVSGSINIGNETDYPAGTDPLALAPFQVQLYDATGTGGMPGNPIGSPIDIQPANFGWITFSLPSYQYIQSGNFYLIMTQGGNSDVAARLAVDNSSNNLRAYSKFVTSGGPWLPADGNFLMRLVVYGQGGPLTDLPEGIDGYKVYRLYQGQEGNLPATWTSVSSPVVTNTVDNSWPSLPDSAYRWAVITKYTGNRLSDPIFSNALGKNRTANVVVNVTLTCAAHPLNGSVVTLTSMAPVEDSVYTATTDVTGKVTFPKVWKGPYELSVTRLGYETYAADVSIYGDHTFDVTALMQKSPPYGMEVDNMSLLATWFPPSAVVKLLDEDWESASFTTNGWTNSPGYWELVSGAGNPGYAAEIYYSWMLTNYDNVNLTSKSISGSGSPDFKLYWDIYLSDYAGDGNEKMTVEISDDAGVSWTTLKEYSNTGSISWTTDNVDIAAYTNSTFQIRFRCHGVDMFNINYWDIDNIKIVATVPDPTPCILAYNVYLNGILDGVTLDTLYNIPPNHVAYGQPYHACVKAVYGSGYSTESCYDFISHFLYPPTMLVADSIECVAYLTWVKPAMAGKVHVPAFKGSLPLTPPSLLSKGLAPIDPSKQKISWPANNEGSKGNIAFGLFGNALNDFDIIDFDVDDVAGATIIANTTSMYWWADVEFPPNQTDWAYAVGTNSGGPNHNLYKIERATGAITDLGALSGLTANHDFTDLAADPLQPNLMYAVCDDPGQLDHIYTIDPASMTATYIGPCLNSGLMVGLACDESGNLWGYDLVTNNFFSIDKTTGLATAVGSIGFNANYGQGLFYDKTGNGITMAAFNYDSGNGEIRAVDVTTGASVILSSVGIQIAAGTLPVLGGHGGDPPGLIGYIVYRDATPLAQIGDKDTTWYYDYTVEPGVHSYQVSAYYDLEPYGFPGEFGESLLEGPDECDIVCGLPLPFFEPWTNASFDIQDWDHEGNWAMSSGIGNPAPSADFSWLPPAVGYDQSLTTPTLNAGPYTCSSIWLDFDLKLVDRNATGDEYLTVEVYKSGGWAEVVEFANNGSLDWTAQHLQLKQCGGKAFKVRFRATGENTQDILHWYVDNISIYAICTPPTSLAGEAIGKNVSLSWTPPECISETPFTIIWDDDSYEAGWTSGSGERWYGNAFPLTPGTAGYITSFDVMFNNMDGSASSIDVRMEVWNESHTMVGFSDMFAQQEDVWQSVSMPNVPFSGTFYGFAYVNNTGTRPFYSSLDTDGPNAYLDYGIRYDGSAWQTIGAYSGTPGVFLVRAHGMLAGKDQKSFTIVPGQNPNSDPNAIHVTNSSEMAIGNGGSHNPSGSGLLLPKSVMETSVEGYNIYRSDDDAQTYHMVNTAIVTDTTYIDVVPVSQEYFYFVTAVFSDQTLTHPFICESDSSNIISVLVVSVEDDPASKGSIKVYPNPATENVNVKSGYTISQIEVMNYVGQTVYNKTDIKAKETKINVASFQSGVYFVKVTTDQGVRTVKITVTK